LKGCNSMKSIVDDLFSLQDVGYKEFISKLVPNIDSETIIGVRTPALRKYASKLNSSEYKHEFLRELPHMYYEENNLHAMLINKLKGIDEVLEHVDAFLPYINNWATCDILPHKLFADYPERVYRKADSWLKSEHTYTVRFAIVTLLSFYLDEHFNEDMLYRLAEVKSDEYYINMALAWYYSFALIKQYAPTVKLFEEKRLGKWVHNKSIQKAVESYRISPEQKQYLRSLKQK